MFVIEEKPTGLLVRCAFCAGKGKDPFGIMSPLSSCYVCGGKMSVQIKKRVEFAKAKDCPLCKGSGVSPTGARNHCIVCDGTGVVCVEESSQSCPNCNGTGWQPHMGLYCIVCKGKGAIPVKRVESKRKE